MSLQPKAVSDVEDVAFVTPENSELPWRRQNGARHPFGVEAPGLWGSQLDSQ